MLPRLLCPLCGEVIGVYERVLVTGGASLRVSSLAREPSLRTSEDIIVHHGCGVMPDTADETAAEPFSPEPSP